jgi:hypothetical protein
LPFVDGTTVRVATTTGLATTAEVVRRLESTGLEVTALQLRQPTLDEVFLSLTDDHGDGDEVIEPEPKRRRWRSSP